MQGTLYTREGYDFGTPSPQLVDNCTYGTIAFPSIKSSLVNATFLILYLATTLQVEAVCVNKALPTTRKLNFVYNMEWQYILCQTHLNRNLVFEMAAMPFPCNGNLLCLCEYTHRFVNVFSINQLVVLSLISIHIYFLLGTALLWAKTVKDCSLMIHPKKGKQH